MEEGQNVDETTHHDHQTPDDTSSSAVSQSTPRKSSSSCPSPPNTSTISSPSHQHDDDGDGDVNRKAPTTDVALPSSSSLTNPPPQPPPPVTDELLLERHRKRRAELMEKLKMRSMSNLGSVKQTVNQKLAKYQKKKEIYENEIKSMCFSWRRHPAFVQVHKFTNHSNVFCVMRCSSDICSFCRHSKIFL